ncbi:MAG: hypothetical protein MZU84_00055 [Sphingobacterium sp.]|nr:hypothetical protein [Sphingobacterium sp.]
MAYSVAPPAAGTINAATGVMDWDAAFSGTATITANATGLCGTTTADRTVTVNPSTGPVNFTLGATTVCQDAGDETYTATAAKQHFDSLLSVSGYCRNNRSCYRSHELGCCFQRNSYYYC